MKRKRHTISMYVANKSGVANRVGLVFTRRGFNIDSLVASEAHDPQFSRITLVASGDEKSLDQILKQLNKLVDVVHARDTTEEDSIIRELALLKIRCTEDNRSEIMKTADEAKCSILDVSEGTLTIEVAGTSTWVDSVHDLFNRYEILEIVRTGRILIARGEKSTS